MNLSTSNDKSLIKLKTSNKEEDLGVIIDDKLTFKDHVFQTTAKANKIVGLIRRAFFISP